MLLSEALLTLPRLTLDSNSRSVASWLGRLRSQTHNTKSLKTCQQSFCCWWCNKQEQSMGTVLLQEVGLPSWQVREPYTLHTWYVA